MTTEQAWSADWISRLSGRLRCTVRMAAKTWAADIGWQNKNTPFQGRINLNKSRLPPFYLNHKFLAIIFFMFSDFLKWLNINIFRGNCEHLTLKCQNFKSLVSFCWLMSFKKVLKLLCLYLSWRWRQRKVIVYQHFLYLKGSINPIPEGDVWLCSCFGKLTPVVSVLIFGDFCWFN